MKNKKNTGSLRNILQANWRSLLAIVFVAVIGFSFFACEEPIKDSIIPDDGGTTPNNGGNNPDNGGTTPIDGIESDEYPGFSYIEENGAITITRYSDREGGSNVTIPSEIEGKPVTGIGSKVFEHGNNITSITIPNSVTSIGDQAFFGCTKLISITIPNSVTSIGYFVFWGCDSLTSITIPNSVTSIAENAFGYNSLTAINVEASNIKYSSDNGVLYNKDKTELYKYPEGKGGSFTVPNGVTCIGYGAFACYDDDHPINVTIPDSVTSTSNEAFIGSINITWCYNPALTAIEFFTGYTYNPYSNIPYVYHVKSVIIPNEVTCIGEGAFRNCTSLTSITIPDSIISIGRAAFQDCTSLTGITIPNRVTEIGGGAFYRCTKLTSITIPDGVTTIEPGTFEDCTSLTSVIIPDSVISIGGGAFQNCANLTSIIIPDRVTEIGWTAFSHTGLTSVTIPDNVTEIGWYAFACPNLTSINMGNSVINNMGFINDCTNFTAINVNDTNAVYSSIDGVLYNKDKTTLYIYPKGRKGAFTIPNSVTSIGDFDYVGVNAFGGCTGLTGITIPDGVTNIGDYAFYYCTGLTNITIPDSVTGIGWFAFSNCTGLTNVTIDNCENGLGYHAFEYCTRLTTVNLGNSFRGNINDGVFEGCTSLTTINVEAANTKYSSINGVLYNKDKTWLYIYPKGRKGVFTIPNSVTNILGYSFKDCTGLTEINISASVIGIVSDAFMGCTGLTKVTIPHSVTFIYGNSFKGCTGLTKVTFVGTIESNQFGTHHWNNIVDSPFDGDLLDKFYANDAENGTPGVYKAIVSANENSIWEWIPENLTASNIPGSYFLNDNDQVRFFSDRTVSLEWAYHFAGSGTWTDSKITINPNLIYEGQEPRTYDFRLIYEDVMKGPGDTYWYRR